MKNTTAAIIQTAIAEQTLTIKLPEATVADQITSDFLTKNADTGKLAINTQSAQFIDALIGIAELNLGEPMPRYIEQGFEFISRYEALLKERIQDNTYNLFAFIIHPMKTQFLVKLHREQADDILDYYKRFRAGLADMKDYRFPEFFFKALLQLKLAPEIIWELLVPSGHQNESQNADREQNVYALALAGTDYDTAVALFEYAKSHASFISVPVAGLLLAGLYDNGFNDAFDEAVGIFDQHPEIAIIAFGAMKSRSAAIVDFVLSLSEKIDHSDLIIIDRYLFTLQKILQQTISPEQTAAIFTILKNFLGFKKEQVTNRVLGTLITWIYGYEAERYQLLSDGLLSGLIKPTFISRYFNNFEDPSYFFELFERICLSPGGRSSSNLFEQAFQHFYSSCPEETEQRVLHYLTHDNKYARQEILKLWIQVRSQVRPLNLLSIPEMTGQLRAAEAMLSFPYGIADILPIVLSLRKSAFSEVVAYLQNEIAFLILNAYHEYLMELVTEHTGDSEGDTLFRAPLQKALDDYNSMRDNKRAHKDLDPRANEKNYMQLYYQLEREQNARMTNEIHNDERSFISSMKTVQIVRGNAWKLEDKPISPLGHFETSIAVDSRMYKNPEIFEINLNHPQSKF